MITKDKLLEIDFDFLIISSTKFYLEIEKEAIDMGITREHILKGQVFTYPLFDYERYISLVKNPVTILSNSCWGGYVYHSLCLPFTSPCINAAIPVDSFMKLISDPCYYFNNSLEMFQEGDTRKELYPIGKIGNGDREIHINFMHEYTYAGAEKSWNRRKERINLNRIFVNLTLRADEFCDELLEDFDKVPFPKICHCSVETDNENILYLKRFERYISDGKPLPANRLYKNYVLKMGDFYKDVDILKLLNGEQFLREI